MHYKDLAHEALRLALKVRLQACGDMVRPVSPYDLCDSLGVGVRFVNIDMEGIYVRDPKPRILISSLRPLVRRNFTCAHELGHHLLGHGSNLENLIQDRDKNDAFVSSEEFLANSFASSLLIPALGVRKAFSSRNWVPKNVTPLQIFTVSSDFGVGYTTFINHLTFSIGILDHAQARRLMKSSPQSIRKDIFGVDSGRPLVVIDEKWLSKTLDVEVGSEILLPENCVPSSGSLVPVAESERKGHFVARKSGICRIASSDLNWGIFVRVMPFQFEGLAKYRHLVHEEGVI